MNNHFDKYQYLKKVYGGLLGKCIGVRLGAPLESPLGTYERIKDVYGNIRGYVKEYKNFAADDDINGPLFFIRALLDYKKPLTAEKIGKTWLNYTREGIGFFWWGGKGISSEHTAYLNLKSGIPAPKSGSAEINGDTIAEQIGGQIFIDSWGLVAPNNPEKASYYASMAASVSHDRNGIYGGIFIASIISMAFSITDIETMIKKALKFIPPDSEYSKVVNAITNFYQSHSQNWREAREFLGENFGYDKYPGGCHIIPNAGVVTLALLYGEGDFAKSIEIATMCGWDTDCNAGNVGTILGVLNGPEKIPLHYRKPINDFFVASSISGFLNIIDLPTASREIAILGLKEKQETVPDSWIPGTFSNDIHLDFSLPGSTCGIRTSSVYFTPLIKNDRESGLLILLDQLKQNEDVRIFYKPYYRREDFDDERYSPTFTPLVYPGENLKLTGKVIKWEGNKLSIMPYVRDSLTKEIFRGKEILISKNSDFSFDWDIPDVTFAIDEIGLIVSNRAEKEFLGKLILTTFDVSGRIKFSINFKDERKEFDGLSRCSLIGHDWKLQKNGLLVNFNKETSDYFLLYTGPYYSKNYHVKTELKPISGESHLLVFHSTGTERGYFFGFHGTNKVVLLKKDSTLNVIKEIHYKWKIGKKYSISVDIEKTQINCFINNKKIFTVNDKDIIPYGMAGVGKLAPGKTEFYKLDFLEF